MKTNTKRDLLKGTSIILKALSTLVEPEPVITELKEGKLADYKIGGYPMEQQFADLKPWRHPIYTTGSADPRCFVNTDPNKSKIKSEFVKGYQSFSGCDVKVIFEEDGVKRNIGTIQGFSYKKTAYKTGDSAKIDLRGTCVFIVFDKQENLLGKKLRMIAKAANEYGDLSVLFDEQIQFEDVSFGISVDDIVSEQTYTFSGTLNETVEQHSKRMDEQDEKYYSEEKAEYKALIEDLGPGTVGSETLKYQEEKKNNE